MSGSGAVPIKAERKRELDRMISAQVLAKLTTPLVISSALPFIANFTAGAIAGVSEILTFYPLGEYP